MKLTILPITAELGKNHTFADNLPAASIRELPVTHRMRRRGFRRRSGDGMMQVFLKLLVWPLLSVKSVHCFAGRHPGSYPVGGIGTLYNLLCPSP